MMSDLLLKQT